MPIKQKEKKNMWLKSEDYFNLKSTSENMCWFSCIHRTDTTKIESVIFKESTKEH